MGIRYMSKERADNLTEIHVYGGACVQGHFKCQGKFNTEHEFSDGFKPDDGWYRIADYTVANLRKFKNRNIPITYSDTCDYVKKRVENEMDEDLKIKEYVKTLKPIEDFKILKKGQKMFHKYSNDVSFVDIFESYDAENDIVHFENHEGESWKGWGKGFWYFVD
ncbi:MAG: hypothetical protein UHN47_05740 [Lachnospiraceae bacterium]|nr:hypothetical protein [Lachnospiraceae bacterium]